MRKILATFIKERILLFRDTVGICILFFMPIFLILIMAMIQDAPFREFQDFKLDILLVDQDGSILGGNIREGLLKSGQFNLVDSANNEVLTDKKAMELVNKGDYKFSILVPKGASARIISNTNRIVNSLSSGMGMPSMLPVSNAKDSLSVALYFDPATKMAFKTSIIQSLSNFLTQTEGKILTDRIQKYMTKGDSSAIANAFDIQSIGLKEETSYFLDKPDYSTNSVQHNVPAWSIFAMFFIGLPLAANMITDKENGSQTRTLLIPNALASILTGKLLFYICISIIQFYLMILVGIYIVPLVGLQSLSLGTHHLATFLTAFCIGYAAVGFGLISGVIFKTPNQVLNLMIITIVILSAIGGIWVPIEIMPEKMQVVGHLSPMQWGLETINNIYLRGMGLEDVWKNLLKLFGFGSALLLLSIFIENRRRHQ